MNNPHIPSIKQHKTKIDCYWKMLKPNKTDLSIFYLISVWVNKTKMIKEIV